MKIVLCWVREWFRPRKKALAAVVVPLLSAACYALGLPPAVLAVLTIALTPVAVYVAPKNGLSRAIPPANRGDVTAVLVVAVLVLAVAVGVLWAKVH
jgi:hypothetical protein